MNGASQDFESFADDVGLTTDQREKALKYWRGEHLYIPCRLRSVIEARRSIVVSLRAQGVGYEDIVDRTGMSERQIRRIEAEEKVVLRPE